MLPSSGETAHGRRGSRQRHRRQTRASVSLLRQRARRAAPACAPLWRARRRGLPIVCLPGLTRNGADFHELATALDRRCRAAAARHRRSIPAAAGAPTTTPTRRTIRFRSSLPTCSRCITALEIGPAIFLGTSRGGILTMLLGAARPGAIAGVILNDIGPGDRPQGPDAHQGLCRQAADAAQLRGRRRDPAPARRRAVPRARRRRLAAPGAADLDAGERRACARLRSEARARRSRASTSNARCRRCGRSSIRSRACR